MEWIYVSMGKSIFSKCNVLMYQEKYFIYDFLKKALFSLKFGLVKLQNLCCK